MDNFIVSARKYRPATFDTVVGQSHITNTLKNAIKNNHLAQAFLFCGPRGVGKTTCARILAKTINCQNLQDNQEACDQCESCLSFKNGNSLNVHELDAASNNSVEDIRSLVEQVRFAPPSGKYKIYIIDEVHMLSTSAFNAFLKTLEEPPSYAIFILATTEKHKIIPTILSRCQIFDFNRIQVEDITQHLAYIAKNEQIQAEEEALHTIAQKADGALRDALSIFDQIVSFAGNQLSYQSVIDNLNILDYDYYFRMTQAIIDEDVKSVLLIFDEILNKGFDGNNCINGLSEHFRNLLVSKDPETLKLLKVSDSIKERYLNQSREVSVGLLMSALSLANQCDIHYKTSKNQRLHVELALMKICHIPSALNLSQLPATQQEVKKKPDTVTNTASEITKSVRENKPAQTPDIPKSPFPPSTPATGGLKKVQRTNSGNGFKLPTLDELNTESPVHKETTETNHPILNLPTETFTESDLLGVWDKLCNDMMKQNKIGLHTLMQMNKPMIVNADQYLLKVSNKVESELFNDERSEILEKIRAALHNFKLDILVEVDESAESHRPYTNLEKFDAMSAKNPNLFLLKDRLGLDLD